MDNNLLSLDQSSRITGYAIFKNAKLIQYGKIVLNEDDLGERLVKLRSSILNLINEFQITEIAFEDIQLQSNIINNVATFKSLAEVFGVIHELVEELNIPYIICPTNTWRAHCGVKGKARADRKKSMQLLVKEWYDVSVSDDIADAVGIGKYVSDTHKKKTEIVNWE